MLVKIKQCLRISFNYRWLIFVTNIHFKTKSLTPAISECQISKLTQSPAVSVSWLVVRRLEFIIIGRWSSSAVNKSDWSSSRSCRSSSPSSLSFLSDANESIVQCSSPACTSATGVRKTVEGRVGCSGGGGTGGASAFSHSRYRLELLHRQN